MDQEKKGMSKGGKVGLGCLGLVVLFAVIGILAGDSTKNSTSSNTTQPSAASSDTTNQSNAPQQYKVGDTVQLKNHQLKVASFQQGWKSTNQFDKPQSSDNEFISVSVEVINNGNDSLDVNSFGFKLEDETGTQRSTTITTGGDGLQSVTLSPGGKTNGVLYFEAKKGSGTLKLHYNPGLFGGTEVTIALK